MINDDKNAIIGPSSISDEYAKIALKICRRLHSVIEMSKTADRLIRYNIIYGTSYVIFFKIIIINKMVGYYVVLRRKRRRRVKNTSRL